MQKEIELLREIQKKLFLDIANFEKSKEREELGIKIEIKPIFCRVQNNREATMLEAITYLIDAQRKDSELAKDVSLGNALSLIQRISYK